MFIPRYWYYETHKNQLEPRCQLELDYIEDRSAIECV